MVVSSPGQKPNEMTSCEYASLVTGSSLELPLGRLGEPGDGEIESVPEEMHRARLAVEPAAELLEDAVRPVEDPAEASYRVVIPGGVLSVLREGCRHRDAERPFENFDIDPEVRSRR